MPVELKDHLGPGLITDPASPGVGDPYDVLVELTDGTHGDRAGGNLHAAAVPAGAAGFMSGADKTKLDGITYPVPAAGIASDAVTLAKMAAGTAGNLITYDAAGDPAAVATGTAGHVLTSNGAGAAPSFQAPSGGGTFTTVRMPEAEPASLSALDDFFSGSSPSWTTFAHAGGYITQTVDTALRRLIMTGTGNGTDRLEGRLLAAPSSEFVIYCWVGPHGQPGETSAGIMVTGGTGSGVNIAGPGMILRPSATANRVGFHLFNTYNANPAHTIDWSGMQGNWMRLRVNGDQLHADASQDGFSWQNYVANSAFPAGTPTHVGLFCAIYSGTCGAVFRNFQVISGGGSSGFDATSIGRNVQVKV